MLTTAIHPRPYRGRRESPIPIGILYSVSGQYGVIGREMLNGILLAIEEVNANPALPFTLAPVIFDPACNLENYYHYCHELLYRHGVRHIVGCYTSASRKQILPLVEGANALLWHTARYEGFESSNNVIYLGAAPNQHVLPMIRYVAEHYQPDIYHIGSDYVWSWEIDRITGETVEPLGGRMIASRLLPLGETEVAAIIEDIIVKKPPVVLVTLVGISAYRFYRVWHDMAADHPFLRSHPIARLSLTLCEAEVNMVGAETVEGYLVSAVYFQSIDTPENAQFLARYRRRFGEDCSPSVDAESAWIGGHMLANAITRCGSDDVALVRQAAYEDVFMAPNGATRIDADNNHAWLTPKLARCGADGKFHIFWQAPEPVKPDPYLTWVGAPEPGAKR